jgi:hypothetical protein
VQANKYELAEVVRRFAKPLIQQENLSAQQIKALHNIAQCRTASMGGHEERCDHCNSIRYSYNSCGDRHCPKCQNTKQAIWVEELMKATLPIKHYHIIFTIPHCLNDVCLWNDKLYYNLFFAAVWKTLHSFGYTQYGAESGAIAVLHSWGQNLSLHPHIHCLVPDAGYSLKGEWKNLGSNGRFIYSVYQLSETFKGKFLDSLKRKLTKMNMPKAFAGHIQKAYQTSWVVNSQPSMADAKHVIRYLGQYTHRVAITNQRILNITNTHVTFIAKDYRDKAQKKPVSMIGVEFLRRFCTHVMPKRFVRIRRYGIYNPITIKNLDLQFVPEQKPQIEDLQKPKEKETSVERIKRLTGFDVGLCTKCNKGRMYVKREIPRIRSPAGHLPSLLISLLY